MRRVIGPVLLGLGAFLVVLAPLLRFQVADRLIAAPADHYGETRLEAPDARYFNVAEGEVETGTLAITVTTRGDVEASEGERVVWDQFTAVNDVTNDVSGISMKTFRGAFNKYTGAAVDCCGAAIDEEPVTIDGQVFLFPFGVEQKTYKVFNTNAGKAYDARFVGEDVVNGLRVYKFEQRVPPTVIDTVTAPASLMGMKGDDEVTLERWYEGVVTYWVEPVSGTPVKQEQQRNEVLRDEDGVERNPALIATATYTPETVEEMVEKAIAARDQIILLTSTLPLVLGAIGGVVLLAGAAATLIGGRAATR